MAEAIKGVGEDGYPMMAYDKPLPSGHPLPMFCHQCDAVNAWADLGNLDYKYPDKTFHVYICAACGRATVSFVVKD